MDADLRRSLGQSLAQVPERAREPLEEGPHRQARRAHIRLREVQQPVVRHRHPLRQSRLACCLDSNTQGGV